MSIDAVLGFLLLSSPSGAARVGAVCLLSALRSLPPPFLSTRSPVHIDPPALVPPPQCERTFCYGSIICPVGGIKTPNLPASCGSRYQASTRSALGRSLAISTTRSLKVSLETVIVPGAPKTSDLSFSGFRATDPPPSTASLWSPVLWVLRFLFQIFFSSAYPSLSQESLDRSPPVRSVGVGSLLKKTTSPSFLSTCPSHLLWHSSLTSALLFVNLTSSVHSEQ